MTKTAFLRIPIDIHFNYSLFLNKMMLKISEHWTFVMEAYSPENDTEKYQALRF